MQLHNAIPAIRGLNAGLIIIGNGTPEQLTRFLKTMKISSSIFTDPSHTAYKIIGAKRGIRTIFQLRVLQNAWRSYRCGFRQNGRMGDVGQQGGILIVLPDGTMAYRYLSREARDRPCIGSILSAVRLSQSC